MFNPKMTSSTSGTPRTLPVDQGWSWVICFASFSCLVLQGLAIQAASVLFLDLVELFDTTVTTASFSLTGYTLCTAAFSVMSPTVLVPLLRERLLTGLTGLCLALSSAGICLAPNVGFFIFFYSLQGACYGVLCVTTSSLTSKYFRRRRGLATTIVMTGLSLPLVAAPTFIRALREEFGVRGAYLILAAIQLHIVPAACTLRPVSTYVDNCIRNGNKPGDLNCPESLYEVKPKNDVEENLSDDTDSGISGQNTDSTDLGYKDGSENSSLLQDNSYCDEKHGLATILSKGFSKSKSKHSLVGDDVGTESNKCGPDMTASAKALGLKLIPISSETTIGSSCPGLERTDKFTDHLTSSKNLSVETTVFLDAHSQPNLEPPKHFLSSGSPYLSMWSLPSIMGSSMMVFGMDNEIPERDDHMRQLRAGGADETEKGDRNNYNDGKLTFLQMCKRLLFPELFRSVTFRFHTLMCLPCGVLLYLLNYVPTIAVVQGGLSREDGALLLTVLGAVDLLSRIFMGMLTDTHVLRPSQIIAAALLGLGTMCLCNELFTTFSSLLIMAVGMGCFIGTRVSLHAALAVELVGEAWMAQGMSVIVLGSTLSTAVHSPLLSALMDATSSFNAVLYYCGGALYVASGSLLLIPFFQAWDKKRDLACQKRLTVKAEEGEVQRLPKTGQRSPLD